MKHVAVMSVVGCVVLGFIGAPLVVLPVWIALMLALGFGIGIMKP
jgi:hypothetical protein